MFFKRKKKIEIPSSEQVRENIISNRLHHAGRIKYWEELIEHATKHLNEARDAHAAYEKALQTLNDAQNERAEAEIEKLVLDFQDDIPGPFDQGVWTECHVFDTGKERIQGVVTPPAEPVNMPGFPITKMMHRDGVPMTLQTPRWDN